MKKVSKRKYAYVPESELNEWKSLFNDHERWGIRTEMEKETKTDDEGGVKRETLNRILLTGRAYETTIEKIRAFVASHQTQGV